MTAIPVEDGYEAEGLLPPTDVDCEQQNHITPNQTVVDGCPVLPKLQCHEVQMGQDARLLWNFKNPGGDEVNITNCIQACESQGSTSSQLDEAFDAVGTPDCGIELRMRELTVATVATRSTACLSRSLMQVRVMCGQLRFLKSWSEVLASTWKSGACSLQISE